MNDNIVAFPGVDLPGGDKAKLTPEEVLHAAHDCYDEIILIGRTKGGNKYECTSTTDTPETLLFHITRVQHQLNTFLDSEGK
jgi:hypothetical protein